MSHRLALSAFASAMFLVTYGQPIHETKALQQLLSGEHYRQWTKIGSSTTLGVDTCASTDERFTFRRNGTVDRMVCEEGKPLTADAAYSIQADAVDGALLTLGGRRYYVTALPSTATKCNGRSNCIRLSAPTGEKRGETYNLYLYR